MVKKRERSKMKWGGRKEEIRREANRVQHIVLPCVFNNPNSVSTYVSVVYVPGPSHMIFQILPASSGREIVDLDWVNCWSRSCMRDFYFQRFTFKVITANRWK